MGRRAKVGGWWRLWIVTSAFWLAVVLGAGYILFPVSEMAPHKVEFVNALPEDFRDHLSIDDTSSVGTEAEFPNGYVMKFRAGTSQEQMNEVAREYARLAQQSQSSDQRDFLKASAAVALIPIILMAIVGLSVAWVRRGFKGASKARIDT